MATTQLNEKVIKPDAPTDQLSFDELYSLTPNFYSRLFFIIESTDILNICRIISFEPGLITGDAQADLIILKLRGQLGFEESGLGLALFDYFDTPSDLRDDKALEALLTKIDQLADAASSLLRLDGIGDKIEDLGEDQQRIVINFINDNLWLVSLPEGEKFLKALFASYAKLLSANQHQ
jgi:hypothetical protein